MLFSLFLGIFSPFWTFFGPFWVWNTKWSHHHESENLPPTQATLKYHTLRAHCQALIWHNAVIAQQPIPNVTEYGWDVEGQVYSPHISDKPPAPLAVLELVKCTCTTSQCITVCSCKKVKMACTEMCRCEADDNECLNVQETEVDGIEEDADLDL